MHPRPFVRNLLGLNLIGLRHLVKGDFRRFLSACERAFNASRYIPVETEEEPLQIEIPEVPLNIIIGSDAADVRVSIREYENGGLPVEQQIAVLALLKKESPQCLLEIGTYMGLTTRLIAENLPHAVVHTVDLPEDFDPQNDASMPAPKDDFHLIRRRRVGRDFLGTPASSRIVQHFADTAGWDFQAARPATAFFIDGSHTFEYCMSDSEKCYELCEGRGLFIWHDCDVGHPGVVQMLNQWRKRGRNVAKVAGLPIAFWKSY